ncbi:dihydrodipicolinate synthase family protein [Cryptosporangium sp. NPDC051539]|uniref:dihydrodipicolinate synthase family protein n=1 Tax=Cryptosporangium sp. NPDC051539 TaxID=3363962 RepID=UPI0037899A4D
MPEHTAFRGVLAAVATPFDADFDVDEAGLRRLVDDLIADGVQGLVPVGSTGEFASLSNAERRRIAEIVLEQAAGRVPVIVHTGAITTKEAIGLSQHAASSGAAGLLLLPPYKDQLSAAENAAYFEAVADSTPLPAIIYNLPVVTGVNLTPEDVAGMAQRSPNIAYVKDTSGDWHQLTRSIHDYREVFTTLVGWDTMLLGALVEGAAGCILGSTNVTAKPFVRVYEAVRAGDLVAARAEWNRVYPLTRFLLSGGYVGGLKGSMEAAGRSIGASRAPIAGLSPERQTEIATILKAMESTAA